MVTFGQRFSPYVRRLQQWARQLKQQTLTLYCAMRHPHMPVPARIIAMLVVAYALSPIDLIPDFIPVLGLLDDLLLVPAGLWLVLRLTPANLLEQARLEATRLGQRPTSKTAALVIVLIWLLLLAIGWHQIQ